MSKARIKVATGATVVLLGGLVGLALSEGSRTQSKTVAEKPVVRTKVIRQTVHVTKHAKPKHHVGAGGGRGGAAGAATGSAGSATTGASSTGSSSSSEAGAVTTSSSGAAAAPEGSGYEPVVTSTSGSAGAAESTGEPVTTATSGSGSAGGGEIESEGGGEHEGGDD